MCLTPGWGAAAQGTHLARRGMCDLARPTIVSHSAGPPPQPYSPAFVPAVPPPLSDLPLLHSCPPFQLSFNLQTAAQATPPPGSLPFPLLPPAPSHVLSSTARELSFTPVPYPHTIILGTLTWFLCKSIHFLLTLSQRSPPSRRLVSLH